MAKSTETILATTPASQGAERGKTALDVKEVEITSANSFAEVLDYDQKGYRVMFACEKGKLLKLSDAEVEQLSTFTRTVYRVMAAQNVTQEAEDPSWAKIKAEFKVGDTRGSAKARMEVTGSKPGMETRYFRPDNLGRAESRGWKPAKPSDYKIAGSHDGHVSIKAHGEDELILFERPKSFREEYEKKRREKKAERAAAEKAEFEDTARRTGYRPLKETEVSQGGYREIE